MRLIWIWCSHAGAKHQVGLQSVTPVVQSIGLRWQGGGWLWQFPLAVEVEDQADGRQERLPIPDPTRVAVWFMLGLALTLLCVAAFTRWRSRRQRRQARKG